MLGKRIQVLLICGIFLLTACTANNSGGQVASDATATLLPIVSQTPRLTATPVPSRTPLPTFTFTPSITSVPPTATVSPTPTATPPITGIVQSLQRVNVRNGPGVEFSAFVALSAGTGLTILGQNEEGTWYNVRMEDGDEGWVLANLVFVENTPTPIPTSTPSPDLTALFLGTPLPTDILGGGTITPTPPRSIATEEPNAPTALPSATAAPLIPVIVDIDVNSINLTATSLAFGIQSPTPIPTVTIEGATEGATEIPLDFSTPIPDTGDGTQIVQLTPPTTVPITAPAAQANASVRQSVRVFALCDDRSLGIAPPTNLASGSTIVVWWAWIARTQDQIQQHLNTGEYAVFVDGNQLDRTWDFRTQAERRGDEWIVYWYVPYDVPLTSGQHQISYRVSWQAPISDGIATYGPGGIPFEEGSCTFNVR